MNPKNRKRSEGSIFFGVLPLACRGEEWRVIGPIRRCIPIAYPDLPHLAVQDEGQWRTGIPQFVTNSLATMRM